MRDGEVLTPQEKFVLPGISRETVIELCGELGIPCREADLDLYDAGIADEIFMTSTSLCICPVRSIGGRTLPDTAARPGDQADQRRLCRLGRLRFRRAIFEALALKGPLPGESRDPLFGIRDGGQVGPGFRRGAEFKLYRLPGFHTALA